MEEQNIKNTKLFDKKLSEIPCFRDSYFYGISTGIGAGFIYFMFTSKPKMSSHIAMGTFAATTLTYWVFCRNQWNKEQENAKMLKDYLKEYIKREGVDEVPSKSNP